MAIESGIYTITSPSGKQYVGSSVNLRQRQKTHFKDLRRGVHHSIKLQNAFNKYGQDALIFEIVLRCEPKFLIVYEQILIDKLRPQYNVSPTAGNCLGVKHSKEVVEKRAAKMRGVKRGPITEEHRQVLRESHMGIPNKTKGTKMPEEHRLKLVAAWDQRRDTQVVSEETRQKIAAKITGLKRSQYVKDCVSAAQKGRVRTPKQREAVGIQQRKRFEDPAERAKCNTRTGVKLSPAEILQRTTTGKSNRAVKRANSAEGVEIARTHMREAAWMFEFEIAEINGSS